MSGNWKNMYGGTVDTMTPRQRKRHTKKTNASKAQVRRPERKKVQLRKERKFVRMFGVGKVED